MFVANELKKTVDKQNLESIREAFVDNLYEVVLKFFADKSMFSMSDFSIQFFDEYILGTNCHETIFTTIYLDIDQPMNYKFSSKPKKNKSKKIQIPELYFSLSDIKKGLYETFLTHFDSNNIVWQDKYSICLKSIIQLEDGSTTNYYFRLIPCLTYYNQNNTKGIMYFYNGDIEIEYPWIAVSNFIQKNKETNGLYRQIILIFKNIIIKEQKVEQLPSEIIETLLYNVPNELFVSDSKSDILNIVNFIRNNPLKEFKTMDEEDFAFSSIYRSMSIFYSKNIMKIIEAYITKN